MILDNIVTLRILYLLTTPFEKQEAFKVGVIDKNGQPLLKLKDMSQEQKKHYSMLHRLVFRLKRMLEKIPGGKTKFASFAAAYLLIKECVHNNEEPENIEQLLEQRVDMIKESELLTESESYTLNENIEAMFKMMDEVAKQMEKYGMITDDAVTTTAGMATYSKPLKLKKRKTQ